MKESYARNKEPVTIWITGISAAGKTTLGTRLYEDLLADGIDNLTFLDGEEVRKSLKKNTAIPSRTVSPCFRTSGN